MPGNANTLRSLYRLFLTPELSKPLQKKAQAAGVAPRRNAITKYVVNRFRNSEPSPKLQQLAENCLSLRIDLKERDRLYELDRGADEKLTPKELTRRAAARAGLQPPKLDVE